MGVLIGDATGDATGEATGEDNTELMTEEMAEDSVSSSKVKLRGLAAFAIVVFAEFHKVAATNIVFCSLECFGCFYWLPSFQLYTCFVLARRRHDAFHLHFYSISHEHEKGGG